MFECIMSSFTFLSIGVLTIALLAGASQAASSNAVALKPGAYRVDLNGKVRELCVDEITIAEFNAKGWQARLAEQGVHCELFNVKAATRSKLNALWSGRCSSPGMGKVFTTRHDVTIKADADSFNALTLLSGDLQARIPMRGERLLENKGQCTSQHDTFRPWQ
jgi:hypothetical protein